MKVLDYNPQNKIYIQIFIHINKYINGEKGQRFLTEELITKGKIITMKNLADT